MRVEFEVEEMERSEEAQQKERDDWGGMVIEGESWRQRRGNWRVKGKRLRGLCWWRWRGGKDGSRGEGR